MRCVATLIPAPTTCAAVDDLPQTHLSRLCVGRDDNLKLVFCSHLSGSCTSISTLMRPASSAWRSW